jgi:monovalent cation:H+ antiporter, CPA1 family
VSSAQRFLALMVGLMCLAVVTRLVSRRAAVPYAVLLAVVGIGVGLLPGIPRHEISENLILLVFIPGLVFEAALSLDVTQLRRLVAPVLLLATVGVAATVLLIGALSHLALGLGWTDGLILGAVLAPTDPVAVVSLLRALRGPGALATLLEGESLFNDGTGVAIFTALLAGVATGPSPADVAGRFAVISAGGLVVGAIAGMIGAALLRLVTEPSSEILITLAIAYGSYLAADIAGFSGIVAAVTAGIVIAAVSRRARLHGREMTDFWTLLAFILNAMLFLLIGTAIPTRHLADALAMVGIAFGIVLLARAVPTYVITALVSSVGRRIPWRWRHMIFWSGLRGALSVALALSLSGRPDVDQRVPLAAYGVVVLSLVVNGGTMRFVSSRLGISAKRRD